MDGLFLISILQNAETFPPHLSFFFESLSFFSFLLSTIELFHDSIEADVGLVLLMLLLTSDIMLLSHPSLCIVKTFFSRSLFAALLGPLLDIKKNACSQQP